jgi:hypothetical protein
MSKEEYDNRGIPMRKFIGAVYAHMISGMPKVSDDQYAARLAICEECTHCNKSDDRWVCKLCSCYLKEGKLLPGKARWATQECPINKWPALPVIEQTPPPKGGCCRG